ncbi:hypothetical protein GUJ93_ZPchr0002g25944 [Zizania palustris]|uniref:histone acetyltransferase n=1 Tax=Zizania palustris TaxID=103762 RepID=A0A8J5VGV5_ZIZPA|nr:hypothetical protein GUJ93_ZPchr0002g25944 [Zizania palustris]
MAGVPLPATACGRGVGRCAASRGGAWGEAGQDTDPTWGNSDGDDAHQRAGQAQAGARSAISLPSSSLTSSGLQVAVAAAGPSPPPLPPRSTQTFAASLPIQSGPAVHAPIGLRCRTASPHSLPRSGGRSKRSATRRWRRASDRTDAGKLVSPERHAAESRTSRRRAEDPAWSSSLSELLMLDPRSEVYPTIEYRPIQPSDLEVLENIHLALFPIRYEREFFLNVVNGHGIVSWGAVDTSRSDDRRDELIGFVTTRVIPAQDCEIEDLFRYNSSRKHLTLVYILTLGVVDSYRNLGIASSLVRELPSFRTVTELILTMGTYRTGHVHIG